MLVWVIAEESVALPDRQKELLSIIVGSFDAYFVDKIPTILPSLYAAIEEHGVDAEGIYRLSGNFTIIKALCEQCYYEDALDFAGAEVHALAGTVKTILREMNPPLCTFKLYDKFLACAANENLVEQSQMLLDVLAKLPSANFENMFLLIQHLKKFGVVPRHHYS